MAFRFGFADDDENSTIADDGKVEHSQPTTSESVKVPPVRDHALKDLLETLPERISYSTVRIESPTGRVLHLPRREIHDIRIQLLGEGGENDEIVDQLNQLDVKTGIYEGGFKTWECAIDLASLLLDRGPRKDIDELIRCDQIIELGAGSALPTLVLFQHALLNAIPLTFVLADYNDTVLRLMTLPNILLTWAANTEYHDFPTPNIDGFAPGDLEISPQVIDRFIAEMKCKDINFVFLSGPWSPSLASLVPESGLEAGTLLLAAETIYSPASTKAFVDILITLLKRVKMAKAMIGAKRFYFGVGGSVDGLKEACREQSAVAYEIENHGVPGMNAGVERALIEVQMY